MKKSTVIGLAGLLVGACAVGLALCWPRTRSEATGANATPRKPPAASSPAPAIATTSPAEPARRARPPEPVAAAGLSPEEKVARIEKIKRDYDEIRAKASADYSAAGANFPGGLNAFMRQLALLEREKRADLAAVLTPQEFEDLEFRETSAGQLVDRLLGPTPATVEQRRAVFRLQREFEDRFALSFDLTPRALFEREASRQQLQEQVRAVLGDELFGSWLFGEGEDYALLVAFAARNNLPPSVPLDVRRIKNELTLQRLELNTSTMPEDQRRAARASLAQQAEARVMALVGPVALQAGREGVLGWLPKK